MRNIGNVTSHLKSSGVDAAASILSTNGRVRTELLRVQRACAEKFDLVAEGRDVGSVVFPNADVKFFLTACVSVRAQRWRSDQKKRSGIDFSLDKAIQTITKRDERDRTRTIAPLICPKDAFVLDNSDLDLDGTLAKMVDVIQKKRGQA